MTDDGRSREGQRASMPTLLKALLRERRLQPYRLFRAEYKKVAGQVNPELINTFPNERTYQRWLNGGVKRLPRAESCIVLEAMFPDYRAERLFGPCESGRREEHGETGPKSPTSTDSPPIDTYEIITLPSHPFAALGNSDGYINSPDGTGAEVEDPMKRRTFSTGLAITMAAPSLLLSASVPARIGIADVDRYRRNLANLRALDHHYGSSDEVYSLAVRSIKHLANTLESASYSSEVGDQLRSLVGESSAHAGWLSFDAGRDADAHSWWLQAQHTARVADDAEAEVYVLQSMSMAAVLSGRGREAIDLARAAGRIARREEPSPRLLSVLSAREARGHALIGDGAATWRALDQAQTELNRDRGANVPAWHAFWGPADLACYIGLSARSLSDMALSERSLRDALAASDRVRYSRTHAFHQTNLASALAARGNVDEAVPVISEAAAQATQVSSYRLTTRVRKVVRELDGRHGDLPAVRELTDWTAANLPAPARNTTSA